VVLVMVSNVVDKVVKNSIIRESLKSRGPCVVLSNKVSSKRVNARAENRAQHEVSESLKSEEMEDEEV